ncbi:MAG: hypothetical protein M1334_00735 [Patescibacteria group bacterium]|nr:hypothetical protein [Patescibacteria group bacterium]
MSYIFIKGNSKMGKKVYIFNIPPLTTCKPTPWCRKNCYALKNNFRLPSVIEAAKNRYQISKIDNFADLAVEEIKKRKIKLVRVHSSGDFYSKEYIGKWIAIASQCPEALFRTTTKRRDFKEEIYKLNSLPNFIVRESLDSSLPSPFMELPLAMIDTIPEAKNQDVIDCVNDCEKCGYRCWFERKSVRFTPH